MNDLAEPAVAAIVLAAGESSRLGQPKQLVQLEGEPLLRRTVRLALEAGCSPVAVVLGAVDQPCREALAGLPADRVRIVRNADWREGMSTSLHVGLAALRAELAALTQPSSPHLSPSTERPPASSGQSPPESVLVLVTDQVQLSADSLRRLLRAHATRNLSVTAANYSGRLGVPAIFRSALWPALAALSGDKGARLLIEANSGHTAAVDMPEAAQELDTPEDLEDLAALAP